jgi:hypothetical protein
VPSRDPAVPLADRGELSHRVAVEGDSRALSRPAGGGGGMAWPALHASVDAPSRDVPLGAAVVEGPEVAPPDEHALMTTTIGRTARSPRCRLMLSSLFLRSQILRPPSGSGSPAHLAIGSSGHRRIPSEKLLLRARYASDRGRPLCVRSGLLVTLVGE